MVVVKITHVKNILERAPLETCPANVRLLKSDISTRGYSILSSCSLNKKKRIIEETPKPTIGTETIPHTDRFATNRETETMDASNRTIPR